MGERCEFSGQISPQVFTWDKMRILLTPLPRLHTGGIVHHTPSNRLSIPTGLKATPSNRQRNPGVAEIGTGSRSFLSPRSMPWNSRSRTSDQTKTQSCVEDRARLGKPTFFIEPIPVPERTTPQSLTTEIRLFPSICSMKPSLLGFNALPSTSCAMAREMERPFACINSGFLFFLSCFSLIFPR